MKKLLIGIVVIGAIFRFTNINWDDFGAFHPDERNISWAVTRIRFFDQLNPKFFAYGGLPIYLYRALGEGMVTLTRDPVWLFDWGHIAVVGRTVSAIVSTASIYIIFLVGTSYFDQKVGLVSALLLSVSPWAIREAHFQTTETMLVFFLLLLLLFAKKKKIVALGVIWGLALAAKTTSALFGVIPLLGVPTRFYIVVFITGLVFVLFSPYTVVDFQHFYQSMTYESGVALGRFSVPYTLQFEGTAPYLYQVTTMLWQAGPLVIAGFIGLVWLAWHRRHLAFLIFPMLYFAWTGSWYAKFARYNVPLLPFLTISCAWLLVKMKRPWLTISLIVVTALWGLMNVGVYLQPQTRIVATDWILKHIPNNATIYTEHWNDGLPLDYPTDKQFNRELLTVYDEPDNDAKRDYYAEKLSVGDYIILSTRRMWATMPKLSLRYPVTSAFYEKLLSGRLGYKEVATFSSYPQVFGFTINDDSAEESIAVFDHPTVRIFQNTGRLTKNALLSIL